MNFFEHQRSARRSTAVMVALFLLATVAVVAGVDLVLVTALVMLGAMEPPAGPGAYALGALVVLGIILAVSGVKILRLAAGGPAVARMVGARAVPPGTTDPLERRLRNVVEEMAIASGVRVPEVYVMDAERGINAFAAGWDVSHAVVAVTRGALETLTRDELQAVVAHEFSHILNGDMRLNIRMIGVLAGIVFFGATGLFILRSVRASRDTAAIHLAALGLLIVGYAGLFFARVIKASISRSREHLADAASVQFTRNPDGMAGALDQIRAGAAGTLLADRHAEDMSHMFFAQGVKVRLEFLFATHPPLDERIRRVHPKFQREQYRARRAVPAAAPKEAADRKPLGRRASDLATAWGRTPVESAALVGTITAATLDSAAGVMAGLDPALREALRTPQGAAAAIIAMMLAAPEEAMRAQLAEVPDELALPAKALQPVTGRLRDADRLPVIDLALPAAKAASAEERGALVAALEKVIHADRRVSLHEFVVLALVKDQLLERPKVAERKRIADLKEEAATVLALVAHAGTRADATGERGAALQAAIRAGAQTMGLGEVQAQLKPAAAHQALEALRALTPMQKGVLVKGLFAAATHDGTIRLGEAELLRLVGAVLDCPLPPLTS